MTKHLWIIFLLTPFLAPQIALCGFANYNSVLIGERAAGMGGAFAALTDDPAACSFYNPATLARMKGASLSTTANIYAKFDTLYGKQDDFSTAPLRVNRGSFVPIPASSGTVYTFRNFAIGLSIVSPDNDIYTGEVRAKTDATSTVSLRDQSLWVGGTVALNIDEIQALGLTMYYTSRSFTRSITDQFTGGGGTMLTNQETTFTNNSLIYILGYWRELNKNWTTGVSFRFPSLEISGEGSFFSAEISSGGTSNVTNESRLSSATEIPAKLAWGIAYEQKKKWAAAFDINYYDTSSYLTLNDDLGGDHIRLRPVLNFSLGGEYYWKSWLAVRLGIFTNHAATQPISSNPARREGDHIDMLGFSANIAIFTSEKSSVTLGGFYSGGRGDSTQLIEGNIEVVPKSLQIFSFLVGTNFHF